MWNSIHVLPGFFNNRKYANRIVTDQRDTSYWMPQIGVCTVCLIKGFAGYS